MPSSAGSAAPAESFIGGVSRIAWIRALAAAMRSVFPQANMRRIIDIES